MGLVGLVGLRDMVGLVELWDTVGLRDWWDMVGLVDMVGLEVTERLMDIVGYVVVEGLVDETSYVFTPFDIMILLVVFRRVLGCSFFLIILKKIRKKKDSIKLFTLVDCFLVN